MIAPAQPYDSSDRPIIARPPIRGLLVAGIAVILLGLGGFATWAALAPLASGAVAPGVVRVDSSRKIVQHAEGGEIIAKLLVQEGDQVAAGQILVQLDDAESRSLVQLLEGQYLALFAQEARLAAERGGAAEMRFPPALEVVRGRHEVSEILTGEEHLFASGEALRAGQTEVLHQRIAALKSQIAAFEAQLAAGSRQLALIGEETAAALDLLAKGLERKPRVLALQRAAAQIEGSQGDFQGRVAQALETIAETRLEILNLGRERIEQAAGEMRQVQTRRVEVEERLAAARIRLTRREVTAPQAGTVLELRYHTQGGVIEPGGAILDLVPAADRLLIEARLAPTDIDVVYAGLAAEVILLAYQSRTMPRLKGRLLQVSADALADERTGQPYYLAKVEVDAAQLANLDRVKLYPGMPAEVIIVTAERTALAYLIQPLRDSFRHAFREQ